MNPGIKLEKISWVEAELWLANDPIVVFPLGAAAKEHGPHLPLNNDAIIANWLADEVVARLPVVVAPLINASFYPAFVDYPGSISLRPETARDLIVDSCRSLMRFGARRFYILNTGLSTEGPLRLVKELLDGEALFEFLSLDAALASLPSDLLQQTHGSHADEHETSLMLHIAPQVVDMSKAVDDGSEGEGLLCRKRGQGIWSASGVYGQATLATAEKGAIVAQAILDHAINEITKLADTDFP